jgi:hypothetical protein
VTPSGTRAPDRIRAVAKALSIRVLPARRIGPKPSTMP